MSDKPPALGDSNTVYKRVQESHPLPDDRGAVINKLSGILSAGGVQKITVEIGRPIKVERLVKVGKETAPEVEGDAPPAEAEDTMSLVRNGEVYDFPQAAKVGPFTYLFQAFHILSQKHLKAKTLMVHSFKELHQWLHLEGFIDVTEIFGVEVVAHPEIPDLTGLLVADVPPNEVAFCIRLTTEPKEKNEANRGEGPKERDSGQRNGRAAGKVGKPS